MRINFDRIAQINLLVVGDVMLDRYWLGDSTRISPEAPVPIININTTEERPGGAGNVAMNLKSLGAQPYLLGVIGEDKNGDILQDRLDDAQINYFFLRKKDSPTITKLRVISFNQQLIRLDFEEKKDLTDQHELLEQFKARLFNAHAVILSDYDKGTLLDPQPFIKLANQAKVPTFVDPKCRDFSAYRGAAVVTPNRKEFESYVGPVHSDKEFIEKGRKLIRDYALTALLITRGDQGMTLLYGEQVDHFPADTREVFDVTGAGDTVVSVFAVACALGAQFTEAAKLANVAAGLVVNKLGAASLTLSELRRAVNAQQNKSKNGILSPHQVVQVIDDAKAHGEKIVMTNGCFDILHAGHVQYLRQAKSLGDQLIVAVNDDASVKRLKGNNRPINSLESRMDVLAGLESVDWVVPFSEDTPENLISQLSPDVLVKGGDYSVETIAGAKTILARGGEVKTLAFLDDYSTSNLLKQMSE